MLIFAEITSNAQNKWNCAISDVEIGRAIISKMAQCAKRSNVNERIANAMRWNITKCAVDEQNIHNRLPRTVRNFERNNSDKQINKCCAKPRFQPKSLCTPTGQKKEAGRRKSANYSTLMFANHKIENLAKTKIARMVNEHCSSRNYFE